MKTLTAFLIISIALWPFIAGAQKTDPRMEKELFSFIFSNGQTQISAETEQWDTLDFTSLHRKWGQEMYASDSIVAGWLADKEQQIVQEASGLHFWDRRRLPSNLKVLDTAVYREKAGKQTLCNCPYMIELGQMSRPIFSDDGLSAVLKIDFSKQRLNSNVCITHYLYYVYEQGTWKTVSSKGTNCMFE